MIRRESGDRGRRPVLFGANRYMIEEIRDSLSHVLHHQPPGEEPGASPANNNNPSSFTLTDLARTEQLSYSSPNLLDKLDRTEQQSQRNGASHSATNSLQNKMTRLGYNQKALAQIRNSLKPYKNCDVVNGVKSCDGNLETGQIADLANGMGQEEDFSTLESQQRLAKARSSDDVLDALDTASIDGRNGITTKSFPLTGFPAGGKVIRKPSFEEKYRHHSVIDDNASLRSNSPSLCERPTNGRPSPPPPLPPRGPASSRGQTPPPPEKSRSVSQRESALGGSVAQRVSPSTPQYQAPPVGKQKVPVVSGKPPAPPPYGQNVNYTTSPHHPTSLAFATSTGVIRGFAVPATPGQSPRALTPTQHPPGTRLIAQPVRLPSPTSQPGTPASPKPAPMQAWGAKQPPIIVQSVKSREVQKPIIQNATAPEVPPRTNLPSGRPVAPSSLQFAPSPSSTNQSPSRLKATAPGQRVVNNKPRLRPSDASPSPTYTQEAMSSRLTSRSNSPISRTPNQSPVSQISSLSTPSTNSDGPPPPPYPKPKPSPDDLPPLPRSLPPDEDDEDDVEKTRCTSPIPERRPEAALRDAQRREFAVRNYSTQAFKFYMEQHVENLLKSHQQRLDRRIQLENEMAKVGLSEEAQHQMRKMLHQKESNYIRLKRAKMNKSMFQTIKTLGIGAFGKVQLVRKRDTQHLYAMKTLRKNDVLKRNQVAHVKAERDILAEADNEWVVKLYYSFQDTDNLYFVMEYIAGGDMMSLLIKLGIFEPGLAQFYIAELVLAIESVHNLGFTHRDIKPDNILIDRSGHIKLTDFGLCTGFRWTHNSKYYQKDGCHERQDSMDPATVGGWRSAEPLKPLVRRRQQQRHLAHSLVGTPNYIAPEVLVRSGYTSCCDWWSVGVILFEMLVGQPPFLANDPAETQYKVIHWYNYLNIPREARLSDSATDLILRLCCSADDRLGRNGADEIKSHAFFHDISFDGLRRQKALHIPVIRHPTDTSNFDPVDSDNSSSDNDDDVNGKSYENGKHPEHAFYEFTFRRFFDEGGHPYSSSLDCGSDAPVYV